MPFSFDIPKWLFVAVAVVATIFVVGAVFYLR